MTNSEDEELGRILQGALSDDGPREAHRQRLREEALAEFDKARSTSVAAPWQQILILGREQMRRPLTRAIAACLILAASAFWFVGPSLQSKAHAFSEFAAALVDAKTARFNLETEVEGQPKITFKFLYQAPGLLRQEMPNDIVSITDQNAGKVLSLDPAKKQAMIVNIKAAPNSPAGGDFDFFQTTMKLLTDNRFAKDNQYEALGEKEIDGVRALGYRLVNRLMILTIWGNPATGLPVRIENELTGIPGAKAVMTNFELNVPLDPKLFDMTPPTDYRVQSIDVDGLAIGEADLVKALRIGADLQGGKFFESLDFTGISQATSLAWAKVGAEPTEEQQRDMVQKSVEIGRGVTFIAMLPESADPRYAGKGVERGAAGTPIFWYKPEGSDKYRVIDADLSVHDAAEAPRVESAVKVERHPATAR